MNSKQLSAILTALLIPSTCFATCHGLIKTLQHPYALKTFIHTNTLSAELTLHTRVLRSIPTIGKYTDMHSTGNRAGDKTVCRRECCCVRDGALRAVDIKFVISSDIQILNSLEDKRSIGELSSRSNCISSKRTDREKIGKYSSQTPVFCVTYFSSLNMITKCYS